MNPEVNKILDKIKSKMANSDSDTEETREEMFGILGELAQLIDVTEYLSLLMKINSPSEDMDIQSSSYGFLLGLQSAIFFPEWARALQQKHYTDIGEDDREKRMKLVLYEGYVRFMPMSLVQEPTNAD